MTINLNTVTLGSDPEFGFINVETGEAVSAHGKIGGNKKEPIDIGNGCGSQEDGVMGEGTIPPCKTKQEFVDYIMYCKQYFDKRIKEYNTNYKCVSISSQLYNPEDLQAKEVREFGCDPSYSIYLGDVSPRPSAEECGKLRSAGFHIHIGTTQNMSINDIEKLIWCMDVFCGLPSVIIDPDQDRKKLYGNPGDFRFKLMPDLSLVEYRTLGGNCHSTPEHIGYFYDQTIKAIEFFNRKDFKQLNEQYYYLVRDAIANNDLTLARSIMSALNIQVTVGTVKNERKTLASV